MKRNVVAAWLQFDGVVAVDVALLLTIAILIFIMSLASELGLQ